MKKLQKIALLALSLCLLVTALSLPVNATEDSPSPYLQWEISENGLQLASFLEGSEEKREYRFVYAEQSSGIKIQPWIYDTYEYANFVSFDEKTYTLSATHKNAEFVFMNRDNSYMIYATEQGKLWAEALINGSPAQYVLCERHNKTRNATLTPELTAAMCAAVTVPAVICDVTDLNLLDSFTLYAIDESASVCYIAGRFYRFSDGKYGYVDHLKLDNTHFDADGSFSYRSGTVEVSMLSAAGLELIQQAVQDIRHNPQEFDSEWNEDFDWNDTDYFNSGLRVMFFITFVALGFLLPIAPVAIGLTKGLSQKRNRRYWLILAAVGALWMLLALLLLILLLALGV